MRRHTIRPWVVAEEAKVKHECGYLIAECQTWTNAHLISASPDLLDALEALLEWQTFAPDEVVRVARAAIKKATRETDE